MIVYGGAHSKCKTQRIGHRNINNTTSKGPTWLWQGNFKCEISISKLAIWKPGHSTCAPDCFRFYELKTKWLIITDTRWWYWFVVWAHTFFMCPSRKLSMNENERHTTAEKIDRERANGEARTNTTENDTHQKSHIRTLNKHHNIDEW